MAVNDNNLFPAIMEREVLSALLQHQVRADLRWIIDSPPLFQGSDGLLALSGDRAESLELLDAVERLLETQPSRRVGLYFESLVDAWLAHALKLAMEARHLQIFENGRTVGEIDFCVRDKNGARWRLECTIKFYLHHPSSQSIHGSAFVGPDPRDSFERKYHHLMERQLRLSVPEFEPVHRALPVARGILFYHVTDPFNPDRPVEANPNHLHGLWMRASEWRDFEGESFDIDRVVHLPKPYWLSGLFNPGLTSQELTWHEAGCAIKVHFEQSNSPLMMSFRSSGGAKNTESVRCIVVNDAWPTFDL